MVLLLLSRAGLEFRRPGPGRAEISPGREKFRPVQDSSAGDMIRRWQKLLEEKCLSLRSQPVTVSKSRILNGMQFNA